MSEQEKMDLVQKQLAEVLAKLNATEAECRELRETLAQLRARAQQDAGPGEGT